MNRKPRTLLLVDNSASILLYLDMLLKRLEYKVVTALTTGDALRMMEDTLPSLVLTGLTMSSLSGGDFLRCMKASARLKDIPVVILTSENDQGMRDACLRLGCTAYLVKPVEPHVLYHTLQSASESNPREHIRLSALLKVIVGDGTVMGGTTRTEYATAISEGGFYVKTLYPQPRNALTPVRLFVGNREIKAKAIVLYCHNPGEGSVQEPGMGMKFVEIADADRALIGNFIRKQLADDIFLP